jgi:hypothetical protein
MKLYFSFGYVKDDGTSERLYHMEEDVDQAVVGKLCNFVKDKLYALV